MSDDLLSQLGAVEREDNADFPQGWEAVIAGNAPASQLVDLEEDGDADAASASGAESRAQRELYAELFTPMTDDDTEALVDRLQAALGGETSTAEEGEALDPAPVSLADARRVKERARPRAWIGAAAMMVAAAAALMLWLRPLAPTDGSSAGADLELAEYSLSVRNEVVRVDRSSEDPGRSEGPARYQRSSQLHWILRPDEALSEDAARALQVRAWASLVGDGAELRSLPLADGVTITTGGVVELKGSLGEVLDLSVGSWRVHFALATAAIPESFAEVRDNAQTIGVQLLTPIDLEVIDAGAQAR